MNAPEKNPVEQLATPVQFLSGVGPSRAELLEKLSYLLGLILVDLATDGFHVVCFHGCPV